MTAVAPAPVPPSTRADDGRPVVVFVDDERQVLEGLRASLRKLRRQYHFHFALGADEALELLAREPVDVVVTDVRMPGTNGVELLRIVRDTHPEIIRYVLSGEAEPHLVVQAIPVTHRWLTKPCLRQEMAAALAEAVRHRSVLADPALRSAVAGAPSLPTPPTIYNELVALLAVPDAPVGEIVAVIEQDPAISAKVLQWANSAFSGGAKVRDLKTAVVRIGLSPLSQLVMLAEVVRSVDSADRIPGFDPDLLQMHIGLVANLAASFAEPEASTTARLGGLFSVIGLLLEASLLPERLAGDYAEAEASDRLLAEVERGRHGVGHPELGGYLLSLWGLPSELVLLAVESHTVPTVDPDDAGGKLPADDAVRVARLVAQRFRHCRRVGAPHLDRLDPELEARLDRWQARLLDEGQI